MKFAAVLFLSILIITSAYCRDFYVSKKGKDTNPGNGLLFIKVWR